MATKVEASSSMKNSPIVYLHGYSQGRDVWYRIDVKSLILHSVIDTNKPKTECWACYALTVRPMPEPMQLSPFAELNCEWGGSWTIIDDDIYYVQRRTGHSNQPVDSDSEEYNSEEVISCNLLKLNTKNPKSGWKIISSFRNFTRDQGYSVVSVGRELFVLGGNGPRNESPVRNNYWGEIYDPDCKTWKALELDIESYEQLHECVVVEKEGEPTMIVRLRNNMLFYNAVTGESHYEDHPSWNGNHNYGEAHSPEGLEACEGIYRLDDVRRRVQPMVDNSTLYWLTHGLYLHGYDIVEKRWFQSKCLKRELWTIPPRSPLDDASSFFIPRLFNLCNGKFLLIVPGCGGKLAAAILVLVKNKDSLNVSVESLHTLLVDDPSFWLDDGMVM